MGQGAAKAGKDLLLKIGNGAGSEIFTTIGGLRGATIKLNAEQIDVTDIASNQWRTILGGTGIRSASISGNGIFTNDASEQLMRSNFLAQTVGNYQLIDVDGNIYQGAFKIKSLDYAGDYKSEVKYTLSLESSGALTYTSSGT